MKTPLDDTHLLIAHSDRSINPFSAGTVFRRQIKTSDSDVYKFILAALKEVNNYYL